MESANKYIAACPLTDIALQTKVIWLNISLQLEEQRKNKFYVSDAIENFLNIAVTKMLLVTFPTKLATSHKLVSLGNIERDEK